MQPRSFTCSLAQGFESLFSFYKPSLIYIYIYILAYYCRQSRSYIFYNYGLSFDSYVNIKICHLLLIIECYRPLFIRLHTRNLKFTNPRALVLSVWQRRNVMVGRDEISITMQSSKCLPKAAQWTSVQAANPFPAVGEMVMRSVPYD